MSQNAPGTAAPPAGNPAVVGLSAFGMTALTLAIHDLGFAGLGPLIWLCFIFGGCVQIIAGFQEQKIGNNFSYAAFTSFGSMLLCIAALFIAKKYDLYPFNPTDFGWFLVGWTLWAAILWVCSLWVSKAMFIAFTAVMAVFVLMDIDKFGGGEEFVKLTAIALLVTVAAVWYMLASILIKSVSGRNLLPVGAPLLK